MDFIKYIAFFAAFVSLIIQTFTKTRKSDASQFQNSTRLGKVLLLLSILAFLFGVIQTWRSDLKSKSNSLAAQMEAKETRFEIQKLSYLISKEVSFQFSFEYRLDKRKEAGLIKYLDSLAHEYDHGRYGSKKDNSVGFYHFEYQKLSKAKLKPIDNSIMFLLGGHIEFTSKSEPLLKLRSNYFYSPQGQNYDDYRKKIKFYYSKAVKSITVDSNPDYSFSLDKQLKTGVTSLLDLEGTFLFLYTTSLFFEETIFDANRIRIHLTLNFGDRSIYVRNLYNLSPAEDKDIFSKYHLPLNGAPAFFEFNITKELIGGSQQSLIPKIDSLAENQDK